MVHLSRISEFSDRLHLEIRRILQKFTIDLINVREVIQLQLQMGKHVLYLPGSYDLVHVGHAAFIQESIDTYLKEHQLQRKDLFVVVLADEDGLIETVKRDKKVEGEPPRPIQNLESLGVLCGDVSPRLIDLASLPYVDLVGVLPAPPKFGDYTRHSSFTTWLDLARQKWATLIKDGKAPDEFRDAFGPLLAHLNTENYGRVSAAYRAYAKNFNIPDVDHIKWRIQDWHFMLHQYIGDVCPGENNIKFSRVISRRDTYAGEVEKTMASCGIQAFLVEDTMVVSTSTLIEQFGWKVLSDSKESHLVNLYRLGQIPFSVGI